jgi:hypothetical protein
MITGADAVVGPLGAGCAAAGEWFSAVAGCFAAFFFVFGAAAGDARSSST